MFQTNKYIVVKNPLNDFHMIIFPPLINHWDMFQTINSKFSYEIISGGYIDEFLNCYGSSMTLRIKSRPEEDTEILHQMLNIKDKEIKFKGWAV